MLAVFFLEDADVLFSEKFLHLVVALAAVDESCVNVVLVAGVHINRIFRIGEHEIDVLAAHEHHVVVPAHFGQPQNARVEGFRTVKIFDGNGEVEDGFGFHGFDPSLLFCGEVRLHAAGWQGAWKYLGKLAPGCYPHY